MAMLQFVCTQCGEVFEELLPAGKSEASCPLCAGEATRKYDGEGSFRVVKYGGGCSGGCSGCSGCSHG